MTETALDLLVEVRQRLTNIVTGDWQPPVALRRHKDGSPSKFDECVHGRMRYEGCTDCVDVELESIAAELDRAISLAICEK